MKEEEMGEKTSKKGKNPNTKAWRRNRKDNVRQDLGAQGHGSKKKCDIDIILVIN